MNTLNTMDSVNGLAGTDTLNAVVNASVTPASLANIEVINVQAKTNNVVLGLDNAGQLTSLKNDQSSKDLTVNNVAAGATTLTVDSATGATTINYVASGPTSTNLSVSGMTTPASQTITVNGVPTVALTSAGSTANVVKLNGDGDTATGNDLHITVAGSTNLTLTSDDANSIVATGTNGSGYTGKLTATLSNAGSLTGGTGDDTLTGSTGNDVITGNNGSDSIVGNGGSDNIAAGEGNNTVNATIGDGNNTVTAGSGNDTITVGDGTTDGNNDVNAGEGNNTVTGGSGNDTIAAGAGNDNITAGDGNDDIRVGAGNNTVVAGLGNDYILTTTGNDEINAGAGDDSVYSGGGNDTITAGAGVDVIDAGSADDRIIFGTGDYTSADSVDGGAGINTLVADQLQLRTVDNNLNQRIQTVEFSDAMAAGTFTAVNVASDGSVNKVVLGSATAPFAATTGAAVLNMNAGNAEVSLRGALGGQLTVYAAGTATGETLTLRNSAGNTNLLAGNAIVTTDYEAVLLDTGTGTTAQTVTTLNIGAGNALTLDGSNGLTASGAITGGTIDASGLDGTGSLQMGAAAVSVTSITGSNNADTLRGQAAASTTIDGGTGADSIYGGTAADDLRGGDGADSITAGGGNDLVRGGVGADTIDGSAAAGMVDFNGDAGNDLVIMGATLTEGDIVKGGDDTDTLSLSAAAVTTVSGGVSEFEVLRATGAMVTQDMTGFSNASQLNNWTTIEDANGTTNGLAITNAGTAITSLKTDGTTGTVSLARAAAGTNTLRVDNYNGTGALATVGTLTVNDEETLTIGGNLTIGTVNANSATGTVSLDSDNGALTITTLDVTSGVNTLSITGDNNVVVSNAITDGTGITTVTSALSNGASLDINVSTSTTAGVTFTGSSAASVGTQSVVSGAGNDVITANNGRLDVVTLNGNDSITGSANGDTIDAGAGNDVITAGTGSDQIIAGLGVDTVTLTAETVGTGNDTLTQRVSDGIAATETNFAGPLVAAGDTMKFGNGVDVIENFTVSTLATQGDVLNVINATGATTSLIGQTVANLTAGQNVYIASGDYNSATGVFTIRADGTGADTAVISADNAAALSGDLTTNESVVILKGVVSTSLQANNFATVPSTYTVTANTVVDAGANTITGGWTATSLIAEGYTSISGDRVAGYTLDVDVSGIAGAGNQTFTLSTGAFTDSGVASSYENLTYQRVNTFAFAGNTNTFTTNDLATGTTVVGGTGVDKLVLTSAIGASSINLGTSTNLTDFENIDASAATGNIQATLVNGSTLYVTSANSDTVTLTGVDLGSTLQVDASAAGNGDTVTITGATSGDAVDFTVGATKTTTADINASGLVASMNLALGNSTDNAITVTTGSAATTVSGSASGDTVTIDADVIANDTSLTVSGAAITNISNAVGDTGFIGNLTATSLTGALQIKLGDNGSDNDISLVLGSNSATITGGAATDTVSVDASAADTADTITIQTSTVGTVATTQIFNVTGLTADLVNAADGAKYITARLDDDAGVAATSLTNNSTSSVITVENGNWELLDVLTLSGAGAFTVGVNGGQEFAGDAEVNAGAGAVAFVVANVDGTQNINSARNITIDATDYTGGNDTLALSGAGTKTVTTGSGAFTIDGAGTGAITVDAAALTANALILTDSATGPAVTINNLDSGDLDASTYAGNITIGSALDPMGGVANQSVVLGSGTNTVYFNSANLTSADTINGGAGTSDTLNVTGNTAIAANDLDNATNIEAVTFATSTSNIAITTQDANFTTSGTFSYTASALTSGTFVFDGTNDGAGADQAAYNISVGSLHTGASTVTGGAAADTISLLGSGNTTVTGADGADQITVGTGTITVALGDNDTGANNTIGAFVGTAEFDVYTGLNVGDKLVIDRSGAAAFSNVNTSTTDVAGADDDITFTRGTYNSGSNLFTASASGSDTLVTYDLLDGAGTDFEGIILVGFVGSSDVGTIADPTVVTLI